MQSFFPTVAVGGLLGNRPAKHGVLLGSVAGSKCTGKNYTGRIWELVSVSKFCPSFCPSFYGHPMSHPPSVILVESYQDFSHPSVTLVGNCQDLATLAANPLSSPASILSHTCTIVLARGTSRCILCRSNLVSCRNVTFVVLNYQVLLVNTIVPTIINASVHNPSVAIGKQS